MDGQLLTTLAQVVAHCQNAHGAAHEGTKAEQMVEITRRAIHSWRDLAEQHKIRSVTTLTGFTRLRQDVTV